MLFLKEEFDVDVVKVDDGFKCFIFNWVEYEWDEGLSNFGWMFCKGWG